MGTCVCSRAFGRPVKGCRIRGIFNQRRRMKTLNLDEEGPENEEAIGVASDAGDEDSD
jgi:hypothetical protein